MRSQLYNYQTQKQWMNCQKCSLTYNKERRPLVFACGHSFCSDCVSLMEVSSCFSCSYSGKPAVNYAILEHVVKKNTSNIDKYIKICLFGNMDVGKSSLLKRLIDDEFQFKTNPTIGIDFKFIDKHIDDKNYRFQIWDSAGQQRYRAVASNHLKGADIILLVYDVSMSYNENGMTYWINQIGNYIEHSNVVVIGNKTDLNSNSNSLTQQEKTLISQKKWINFKVSCLDCTNIKQLWEKIINISRVAKGTTAKQKMKSVMLGSNILETHSNKSNLKKQSSRNIKEEKKTNCCS